MTDELKPCPRAKSDMTPCILNDSWTAMSDDGHCVGCGIVLDDILTEGQQAQAERDAYRKLLERWVKNYNIKRPLWDEAKAELAKWKK